MEEARGSLQFFNGRAHRFRLNTEKAAEFNWYSIFVRDFSNGHIIHVVLW
jgi:hypothetical protein